MRALLTGLLFVPSFYLFTFVRHNLLKRNWLAAAGAALIAAAALVLSLLVIWQTEYEI